MFLWFPLIAGMVSVPVGRVASIPFDRRRRWRAGKGVTPPGTGNCAAWQVVDLAIERERVDTVVVGALRRCGVTPEARPAPPSWWVGYTGFSWKTGTWGFEFAVGVDPQMQSPVRFWCCTRPRLSIGLIDFGMSDRRANRLAKALRQEAAGSPGPGTTNA